MKAIQGSCLGDKDKEKKSSKFLFWKYPLIVSTYNVRTLLKSGKFFELCRGAELNNIDAICIQEHHWKTDLDWNEVSSNDKKWTFIYASAEKHGNGGVGILVNKKIYSKINTIEKISSRILTININSNPRATITAVYAPTETSAENKKLAFYKDLSSFATNLPSHNLHLIGGDFNAQIGADITSYTKNIGQYTYHATTNNNGLLLAEFCNGENFAVLQSKFPHGPNRKWTWEHPNGTKTQIDHMLINGKWVRSVQNCRAYNSLYLNSDHRIVSVHIKLRLSACNSKNMQKRLNWDGLKDQNTQTRYKQAILARLLTESSSDNQEENVNKFNKIISEASLSVLSTTQKKKDNREWVSQPTIDQIDYRNSLKMKARQTDNVQIQQNLKLANDLVYNSLKKDKDIYMQDICRKLENFQKNHKSREVYETVKQLSKKEKKPKKLRIKGQHGKILENEDALLEWKRHFQNLLNNDNISSELPPDIVVNQDLPINCNGFSLQELITALKQLKSDKAPGVDNITVEAIEHGGEELQNVLLALLNDALLNGQFPSQWKEGQIIPIPKKGNLNKPENYRGITLLPVTLKLYNKMLLNRIEPHITPCLRRNQAGFLKNRSTTEHIHCIRRLLEGSKDKNLPLCLTFIDFSKAFDSINRRNMFYILQFYGIPQVIIKAIAAPYQDFYSRVLVNGELTEKFCISTGVLQGDTLAPYLFIITLDYIFRIVGEDFGITIESNNCIISLSDLGFADDIVLLDYSLLNAQQHFNRLCQAAEIFGLKINATKTKVIKLKIQGTIFYGPQPLEDVEDFQYLGSYINSSINDIIKRKQKALHHHRELMNIWKSSLISLNTKIRLYKTTTQAIFLYGSETWNVSTLKATNTINSLNTSCLRTILGYTWRDHIRNTTVLTECDEDPLMVTLQNRQLKWLGHYLRHPPSPYFAALALFKPENGKRGRGRPNRQFWQYVGQLVNAEEPPSPTEIILMAQDRDCWKSLYLS